MKLDWFSPFFFSVHPSSVLT